VDAQFSEQLLKITETCSHKVYFIDVIYFSDWDVSGVGEIKIKINKCIFVVVILLLNATLLQSQEILLDMRRGRPFSFEGLDHGYHSRHDLKACGCVQESHKRAHRSC
jgi:hypothetical protein